MPLDSNDVIWSEGYRAFNSNNDEKHNPYLSGSSAYELWNDGYEDARIETNEENNG